MDGETVSQLDSFLSVSVLPFSLPPPSFSLSPLLSPLLYFVMMVRVRRYDRMHCSECGKTTEEGGEVLLIDDMVCCLPCSVEYLLTRIESLERRVEELEIQNGIAVPV